VIKLETLIAILQSKYNCITTFTIELEKYKSKTFNYSSTIEFVIENKYAINLEFRCKMEYGINLYYEQIQSNQNKLLDDVEICKKKSDFILAKLQSIGNQIVNYSACEIQMPFYKIDWKKALEKENL
jgi:hypothetical protein